MSIYGRWTVTFFELLFRQRKRSWRCRTASSSMGRLYLLDRRSEVRPWTGLHLKREVFTIFQTFEKLEYMLLWHVCTLLLTKHRNPLSVLAPFVLQKTLGKHIICEVQRWILHLSKLNYVIERVRDDENTFADMLTLWTPEHCTEKSMCCSVLLQEMQQLDPTANSVACFDIDTIRASQKRQSPNEMVELDVTDGLSQKNGRIWIPEQESEP